MDADVALVGGAQRHLLEFARGGPARYLSHLDTARAIQRTFVRAGVRLALSHGMRPKPRLALGLPLPVGAAGLGELAVADLVPDADGQHVVVDVAALAAAAPPGLEIVALRPCHRHLRLRPRLAIYEWSVDVWAGTLAAAAARLAAAASVPYVRTSPKGDRTLDLRRYVDAIDVEPFNGGARLRFAVRHLTDGAARPAEVLARLLEWSGGDEFDGAERLVLPTAPADDRARERAGHATEGPGGREADGRPARVVNAALTRLGVVYDGLAASGPAEEWLERHARQTQTEGSAARRAELGGDGD